MKQRTGYDKRTRDQLREAGKALEPARDASSAIKARELLGSERELARCATQKSTSRETLYLFFVAIGKGYRLGAPVHLQGRQDSISYFGP